MRTETADAIELSLPYDFSPRSYQWRMYRAWDEGIKRFGLVWHRRSGKDKTCLNFCIERMFERKGNYFHIFPKLNQGRRVIWDGIDRDGKRYLDHFPPELIFGEPNKADMQITLRDPADLRMPGSTYQVLGTDRNLDVLVGGNGVGYIFSEYALQNPRAWDLARPILRENGGWAAFCYCVTGDTFVLTPEGLRPIASLVPHAAPGFTDVTFPIYGRGGFHTATAFYNGGRQPVRRFVTRTGYSLTCTPPHPLWDGWQWKKAQDWKVGDRIPLQRGQQVWGTSTDLDGWQRTGRRASRKSFAQHFASTDLLYLFGLALAEGSWSQYTLTITNTDPEIIAWLHARGFVSTDGVHHWYCSSDLIACLEWFGLRKGAKHKQIPDQLLGMTKPCIVAFLQGYFDGDGSAHQRKTAVHCDSVSEQLMTTLQILLLNFGIVARKSPYVVAPTARVQVFSHGWRLSIEGHSAALFYEQIGFRLTRKQACAATIRACHRDGYNDYVEMPRALLDDYIQGLNETDLKRHTRVSYRTLRRCLAKKPHAVLQQIVDDGYFYDEIVGIEETEADVFDFVIPETHSFFSNGFVSHNTPRGKNHGYTLWKTNYNNPDWYFELLTVEQTRRDGRGERGDPVVSPEDIAADRREGMLQDLIDQEYYLSWEAAIPGAYYANEFRLVDSQRRITRCPYDPSYPVYTFWDIGVNDANAIWFVQFIGRQICLLRYYEHTGYGAPYYADYLRSLPYHGNYRAHVLPHDGRVRDWGSGERREVTLQRLVHGEVHVTQRPPLDVGIENVRLMFPRLLFDEAGCSDGEDVREGHRWGIEALREYHHAWDEERKTFLATPEHNWASHASDSLRTLAVSLDLVDQIEKAHEGTPLPAPVLPGGWRHGGTAMPSATGWMG